MRKLTRTEGLVVMIVTILINMTGCSTERGWRVSFGVAPISNIEDQQGLREQPQLKQARY